MHQTWKLSKRFFYSVDSYLVAIHVYTHDLFCLPYLQVADQENHKVRFAYTTSKEVLEEKKYDGFSIVVHLAV